MDRDRWIPIAGLIGLILGGIVLLYATASPTRAPSKPSMKGAPKARMTQVPREKAEKRAAPPRESSLLFKRPVGERVDAAEGADNLVLVVLSAVRRDQLTPYGGLETVTPWLNGMASDGARFTDAIAAGGWALPAYTAIATGDHALALGMTEAKKSPNKRRLSIKVETLAERLTARGYYTMAVNAEPAARRESGLAQGFDQHRDADPKGYSTQRKLRAPKVVDEARQMLARRSDDEKARPFFLQLNFVDLHKPIKIPPAESKVFADGESKNAPYLGVLHRIDEALRDLDDLLDDIGAADDTFLVVLGAHGEGLNMPPLHGKTHGRTVYPSIAEIPWIVRGPGLPAGAEIPGVASQVDVMPTLLGLLGLPAGGNVQGRDWSAALRGEQWRLDRDEAFIDTWFGAGNRAAIYTHDVACQIDFSTAKNPEGYQDGCFDRVQDPEWTTPIKRPKLTSRLEAWRKRTQARAPASPAKVAKAAKRKKSKAPGEGGDEAAVELTDTDVEGFEALTEERKSPNP